VEYKREAATQDIVEPKAKEVVVRTDFTVND
jgi:hypothetical protein